MKLEDLVVCHNGRTIEPAEYTTITPLPGDFVGVCPVVGKSGGKKNILQILASVALMFVSAGVGNVVSGAKFGAAGAKLTMAGRLAATATMVLGGMVINHLFPPPKIENQQDSPTYSWGKIQSMQGQGNPVAITYGTVRTAGQIVAYDIESDGDKQYLKLLLCGGEGPVDEISDILINDQPVSNYKDIIVETRLGTNDQTVIQNFNDTFANQDIGTELLVDGSWVTRITDGNGGQGLRVTLEFPYGLYFIDDKGRKKNATVKILAQYRKEGTAWQDWAEWEITAAKNSGVYRKAFRIDNLPIGRYEVRLQCTYKSGEDPQHYATRVYWSELSHIIYDDFSRPGKVLVGIKALATDQLSGSIPNITWLQKRNYVNVWDANTQQYVLKPATNPAWACYDLIHRCKLLKNVQTDLDEFTVFGVPASRMDYQAFVDWAEFCDYVIDAQTGEKRCTVNIILDSISDLWGALRNIEICGRGKIVLKGTRFSAVCDKPSDPVMLFTMGNIVPNTFQEEFLPLKDRANAIEITFFNKDKGYQRDVLTVYGDDYDSVDAVPVVAQITLPGVTTVSEAYRAGKYRLKLNKYLIRTCSWEADIDALACQVGDVVNFAHDVPEWGQSGRIVSVERIVTDHITDEVRLDRMVLLEPGKAYALAIRLEDDRLLEVPVKGVTVNTETDIVTMQEPFETLPKRDDIYSFGLVNMVTKPLRLLYLTRSGDMRRKLTALEYIPEVYSEATDIPVINYSGAANAVTNVAVSGRVSGDDLFLDITWTPSRLYNGARILIDGQKVGEVGADKTSISIPVILFKLYEVSVVALDIFGNAGTATTMNYVFVDPGSGIGTPPPDITYFAVSVLAAQVLFSLKLASADYANTNIIGIEFRRGDSWESAQLVSRGAAGNDEATAPAYKGTHRYWAAAYNHYGYSANPISDVITIDTMPEKEKVLEYYSYDDGNRTITGDYAAIGTFTVQKTALTYTAIMTMPWSTLQSTRLLSPTVGTYTITGDVIDIGKVAQVLIAPEETWFVTPDAPSLYEIQTSVNGTDWSDWKLLTSGLISLRYFKIRFTVCGVNRCGMLRDVKIVVSAKTQTLKIENVAVPVGGVDITFNPPFIFKPAIVVTPSNNAYTPQKTLETNAGFKVQLFNGSTEVSGITDIVAIGF
ncbi:MAG: host specificity factor TipJ family phage tail protein [Negativicutes bacterium]|nr:host specificity factor TipJ family phage tail protein [Negativicutes bacterium]